MSARAPKSFRAVIPAQEIEVDEEYADTEVMDSEQDVKDVKLAIEGENLPFDILAHLPQHKGPKPALQEIEYEAT